MNIIEHLEQTVSTVVLADSTDAAKLSLLEQFYAILATRLSSSKVYSALQRSHQISTPIHDAIHDSLFEQVWQDPQARQIIIKELSATHHINEIVTAQLVINATPIAYQALNAHAKGQFLPAYLQTEQSVLRQYLPIWSAPIIADLSSDATADNSTLSHPPHTLYDTQPATSNELAASGLDGASSATVLVPIEHLEEEVPTTDAIHANPSDHRITQDNLQPFKKVRAHNKSVRKISWLLFALAVLAGMGLTWALIIKPKQAVVDISTPQPIATPVEEPVVVPLTPISMTVGVDNSGQLYTCNAEVGDANLQRALIQAISVSFGDQAGICDITVTDGVATSLSNMATEKLSDMLTLLRAVPFARMQLQNERIVLEAPDAVMLQQLLTDMQIVVPLMTFDSAAPIPLPDNSTMNNQNNMANMNGPNNSFESDNINNLDNGEINNYQAGDDDTNDIVIPDPLGNNTQNRPQNMNQGVNSFSSAPSGPISLSEVDEMASQEIRVDPVRANQ